MGVRDGTLPKHAFRVWLVQDYLFVEALERAQARVAAAAPRAHMEVLAAGVVGALEELRWFEQQARSLGVSLAAEPLPSCRAYCDYPLAPTYAPYPVQLTATWAPGCVQRSPGGSSPTPPTPPGARGACPPHAGEVRLSPQMALLYGWSRRGKAEANHFRLLESGIRAPCTPNRVRGYTMASCPSCHNELPAGTRWCTICATNVLDPAVGRLASPAKRLGAYVLDVVIPFAAWFFLLTAAGMEKGLWGILALIIAIGYPIWALVTFATGTSPGKQLLGMFVLKQDGRRAGFGTMLLREWIGKLLSGLVFGLGYLWILFDRERQGWHDKLTSTYVVERASGR